VEVGVAESENGGVLFSLLFLSIATYFSLNIDYICENIGEWPYQDVWKSSRRNSREKNTLEMGSTPVHFWEVWNTAQA